MSENRTQGPSCTRRVFDRQNGRSLQQPVSTALRLFARPSLAACVERPRGASPTPPPRQRAAQNFLSKTAKKNFFFNFLSRARISPYGCIARRCISVVVVAAAAAAACEFFSARRSDPRTVEIALAPRCRPPNCTPKIDNPAKFFPRKFSNFS